ncbi:hypothetical protein MtrunA17_Chr1g0175481 [Medicago truncatula]|uniref:Uncharacterized protein n=1 Tax=Medicago truncatula TaxID=3880 RepID=A0A072VJT5_MEDTR|nr:hypothetical protein MTR_1g054150 [Medicago truncatula]RHN79270.1 hypothetical protein MtrunA17_Chr1g0175481 [Medicago truncatula]
MDYSMHQPWTSYPLASINPVTSLLRLGVLVPTPVSYAGEQPHITNPFHQCNPPLVQEIQWRNNGDLNLEPPWKFPHLKSMLNKVSIPARKCVASSNRSLGEASTIGSQLYR